MAPGNSYLSRWFRSLQSLHYIDRWDQRHMQHYLDIRHSQLLKRMNNRNNQPSDKNIQPSIKQFGLLKILCIKNGRRKKNPFIFGDKLLYHFSQFLVSVYNRVKYIQALSDKRMIGCPTQSRLPNTIRIFFESILSHSFICTEH